MHLSGSRSGTQIRPDAAGIDRAAPRLSAERGSVLVLVPAGFLVLILLAALAVDSAVAYLGQQQLHDVLSAAANDAVAAGLDDPAFYRNGTLTLDPATVAGEVCADVAAQDDRGLRDVSLDVAVAGNALRLTGSASVNAVFGRAIPGFGQPAVHSSADATLSSGPSPAPGLSQLSTTFGPVIPVHCAGL